PIYDGYCPSGCPTTLFGPRDVPLIQVISDGDVAYPVPWASRDGDSRPYRRDDCDEPGDRYRLYELAGMPHMGTRNPPHDNTDFWISFGEKVPPGSVMNSLPHNELFNVTLHHLVLWVTAGTAPPRAPRIEVGPDGHFAKDDHGNSIGGVRCAQMDIP